MTGRSRRAPPPEERGRRALQALAASLVGAGLAYGGVLIWRSPAVELTTIEVSGNRRVGSSEVVAASGLEPGDHLFRVKVDRVARQVEAIAWIERARVERIIPSRIRVTVAERRPVAAVVLPGATFLADRSGVVLEEGSADGLLGVADLPLEVPSPGDQITHAQFGQALRIVESLPAELRRAVQVVRAPTAERISLELEGGTVIVYGPAREMEQKNLAITAVLEREQAVASIDVRVPSRPAVRPR